MLSVFGFPNVLFSCTECVSNTFRESSLLWPGETECSGRGSAESSWGHFHPRLWAWRPLQGRPVPPVHRLLLVCSGGHGTPHSWNLYQVRLSEKSRKETISFIIVVTDVFKWFDMYLCLSAIIWITDMLITGLLKCVKNNNLSNFKQECSTVVNLRASENEWLWSHNHQSRNPFLKSTYWFQNLRQSIPQNNSLGSTKEKLKNNTPFCYKSD